MEHETNTAALAKILQEKETALLELKARLDRPEPEQLDTAIEVIMPELDDAEKER